MKWTISRKLFILFSVMSLSFVCFAFYMMHDLTNFESSLLQYETKHGQIRTLKHLQINILNIWQYITDASLTKDRSVITSKAKTNYDEARKNIDALMRPNEGDPAGLKKIEVFRDELDAMWNAGNRMFDAYLTDWERGNDVMKEFDLASDRLITDIGSHVSNDETAEDNETHALLMNVQRSKWILIAVLGIGILNIMGILYFLRTLTGSITKPLASLAKAAHEIADGNLSVTIKDIRVRNEVGALAQDFNKMTESLRTIISNVKDNVAQLASAAEEMASTSEQIVDGSQEQSSKSSQVANAAQQLSTTIIDVAKNASEAAETAKKASRVAMEGGDIVDKSIESINSIASVSKGTAQMMENLGNRSIEVGTIIKVIDDIANQTNLLALNAAIEAARAGDQGRGFAVVADEVRKLAEKTTTATKEISETIKTIQGYTNDAVLSMKNEMHVVEDGVSFARNAGTALKEIVAQVEAVSGLITQIATSSEEQSSAAYQISDDIEVVAGISGTATASAQQIATASQNLAVLAAELQSNVARFRIS